MSELRFGWTNISRKELLEWPLRIAEEKSASIRQSPLFNERFRRFGMKPIYLKCLNESGETKGFVCIITLGFLFLRIGAVIDGPVAIGQWGEDGEEMKALVSWLTNAGFIFVRFSHRYQSMIDVLSKRREAVFENPLPFIPRYGGELAVNLESDNQVMLNRFQQIARQEIKRASDAGCVITKTESLEEFKKLWPIYSERARQKGIGLGTLEDYESMFKLSPRSDLVRIYNAFYGNELVYTSVFMRENVMAHHVLGALNLAGLRTNPSPSCLLHWRAMCDYRDLGCQQYNLGGPSGSVFAFKRKFRPVEIPLPVIITLVFRNIIYRAWTGIVVPVLLLYGRVASWLRMRKQVRQSIKTGRPQTGVPVSNGVF